jgi:DNA polymerase
LQGSAIRSTPAAAGNQSHPSSNVAAHNVAPPARAGAAAATQGTVEDARALAANAASLEALRATLGAYNGCSLKFSAKSLVFGDGNPNADVMFIGEAPGRDEDLQGVPFVGRAGQLLDKMMAAVHLDRSCSYITNILPWRPPGNRKPSLDEQALMQPFIHRHIELVNPKVLVFLGGTSAQQLLNSKDGIMRLRGRWRTYAIGGQDRPHREIPAMSTLHPAFLLRTPAQKRAAWQDLLEVAAKLKEFQS